jgi:hypothetical protein
MGIGFLCSNITRAEFGALMNPRGKNKRDVWTINADISLNGKENTAKTPEPMISGLTALACIHQM